MIALIVSLASQNHIRLQINYNLAKRHIITRHV